MVTVKICGVTSVGDALLARDAGADAIGINFWRGSSRFCSTHIARDIIEALGDDFMTVGVFVDATLDEMKRIKTRTNFICAQLHGAESPDMVQSLLPHAYKGLRVKDSEIIAEAARYPGEYILLDAFVPGLAGGTGETFDWSLAKTIAENRKLILAGGLTPDNVAEAVRAVSPYGVDVASGVESSAGKKDPKLVSRFIEAVKKV